MCEYLSTELELPSQISVRIRVYANKKGLASAYSHNKIIGNADDFDMFVRGFNMGHPMCDFVDAGDGKECADSKLKGTSPKFMEYEICWKGTFVTDTRRRMFHARYGGRPMSSGHLWWFSR